MKKHRYTGVLFPLLGLGAVTALAIVIASGKGMPETPAVASAEVAATPVITPVITATAIPATPEPTPEPTETPEPTATPTAVPEVNDLMEDIADALGDSRYEDVPAMLEKLTALDPGRGSDWSYLADYWQQSEKEGFVQSALPEDLPGDNSLCLVVFGYQLTKKGNIKPELEARLEMALACAKQYPNAYILVTGGGTAEDNKEATEAGLMAGWLKKNGIASERILVEDDSTTTGENIKYSYTLMSRHPEITSVAVITTDYHVRRCCVLFTSRFLMKRSPLRVVANAASTMGKHAQEKPAMIADGMASLYGVK